MNLLSKGLLTAAGSYVVLAATVVNSVVLSRAIGPSGVGEVSLLRQTVTFFIQVGHLGLPIAMIHQIRKGNAMPFTALFTILSTCAILAGLSVVAIILIVVAAGNDFFGSAEPNILIGLTIWVFFVIIRAVLYNYLIAKMDIKSTLVVDLLPSVTLAGWYIINYWLENITVGFVIVSEGVFMGCISMFTALYCVVAENSKNPAPKQNWFDAEILKSCFVRGWKLVMGAMLLFANTYVALMSLRWHGCDFNEVGYFTRGLTLATISGLSIQSLQRLLFSHWSDCDKSKKISSFKMVCNGTVMFLLMICGLFLMLAYPVTVILFGKEFVPSVAISRICIGGVGCLLVVKLVLNFLNADDKSHLSMGILCCGLATNVIVTQVLVPSHAATGAAWALLLSYLVMMAIAMTVMCRIYSIKLKSLLIPNRKTAFAGFSQIKLIYNKLCE
jgi:O-antigen/teichoic acid export membrane protein